MRYFILLFLFLSASASGEEWQSYDGNFMAMVFLSENPDQIYSSWNNGPNNGVKITALPVIDNGKRFEAIVIFSGCVADESGNCNVVADWSVNTVTGKSLGEIKNAPLWVDRPPTLGHSI